MILVVSFYSIDIEGNEISILDNSATLPAPTFRLGTLFLHHVDNVFVTLLRQAAFNKKAEVLVGNIARVRRGGGCKTTLHFSSLLKGESSSLLLSLLCEKRIPRWAHHHSSSLYKSTGRHSPPTLLLPPCCNVTASMSVAAG